MCGSVESGHRKSSPGELPLSLRRWWNSAGWRDVGRRLFGFHYTSSLKTKLMAVETVTAGVLAVFITIFFRAGRKHLAAQATGSNGERGGGLGLRN